MLPINPLVCLESGPIDDLTETCLRLAVSPEESRRIYENLGPFFRDSRNRLNDLKLALYLLTRSKESASDATLRELSRSYGCLEDLIERFQQICCPAPMERTTTDFDLLLSQRRGNWASQLAHRSCSLDWLPPDTAVICDCDPEGMAAGLDALAEWRAAEAVPGCRVRVAWWENEGDTHFVWEETRLADASGAASEAVEPRPLALPILARVVAAHGGRLHFGDRNGVQIEFEWPRIAPVTPPQPPASTDAPANPTARP